MENALRGVAGVTHAEASFEGEIATVSFAGGVKVPDLISAIEAMGFDATLTSPPSLVLKVEGMMCQVRSTWLDSAACFLRCS